MRKNLLFFLMAMLLPCLAWAENMAIQKTKASAYSSYNVTENRLAIPTEPLGFSSMDGTEDYNYTFASWVKPTDIYSGGSVVLAFGPQVHMNANGNWALLTTPSGVLSVGGHGGATDHGAGTVLKDACTFTGGIAINEWNYVSVVVDNTNLKFYVYVNGQVVCDATMSGSLYFPKNLQDGGDGPAKFNVAGYGQSALIDEAHLFNKALSADEVAQAYADPTKLESLVGYYTFDEQYEDGKFMNLAPGAMDDTPAVFNKWAGEYMWGGWINGTNTPIAATLVAGREIAPVVTMYSITAPSASDFENVADILLTLVNADDSETLISAGTSLDVAEGSTLKLKVQPADGYTLTGATVAGEPITFSAEEGGYSIATFVANSALAAADFAVTTEAEAPAGLKCRRYYTEGSKRYYSEVSYTLDGNKTVLHSTDDPTAEPYFVQPVEGAWQEEGAYIDMRDKVLEIPAGTEKFTVTLKTNPNNCSSKWSQNAVLIDWNNDGTYTEQGENYGVINIHKKPNQAGGGLVATEAGDNQEVTIPADLQPGTYSMLVLMMEPKRIYSSGPTDMWDQSWNWTYHAFEAQAGYISLTNGQAYEFTVKVTEAAATTHVMTITQPEHATITVKNGEEVVESGAAVAEGAELTLECVADEGYALVNYTLDGANVEGNTVTVPAADFTISAIVESTAIDYCAPTDVYTNRTDRVLTSINVNGTEISGFSSGYRCVYADRTETVVTAEAGSTITITSAGKGSWMHTMIYGDFDNNGWTIPENPHTPGGDLLWFNRIQDMSQAGEVVYKIDGTVCNNATEEHNGSVDGINAEITIPADLAPGDYRMRYKNDWGNPDPCGTLTGSNTMANNGGAVIDFTLRVTEAAEPTPDKGLEFDGTRYMVIPHSTEFDVAKGGQFSVTALVWVNAYGHTNGFVSNYWREEGAEKKAAVGYSMYGGQSEEESFGCNFNTRHNGTFNPVQHMYPSKSKGYLTPGKWERVTWVFDGLNGSATTYLNGVMISSKYIMNNDVMVISNYPLDSPADILVGAMYDIENAPSTVDTRSLMQGWIADVRFYNKALTTVDLSNGVENVTEGLIAAYNFEGVTGKSVPDVSGNGHTAKLVTYPAPTHTLTITQPANATITVKNGEEVVESGAAVAEDTELTLSAEVSKGYKLDYFTLDGNRLAGNTVTVPEADFTISASISEFVREVVETKTFTGNIHITVNTSSQDLTGVEVELRLMNDGTYDVVLKDFGQTGKDVVIEGVTLDGENLSGSDSSVEIWAGPNAKGTVTGTYDGTDLTLSVTLKSTFVNATAEFTTVKEDTGMKYRRYSTDGSKRYLNEIAYSYDEQPETVAYSTTDPTSEPYFVAPTSGAWKEEGAYIDLTDKVIEIPVNAENLTVILKSDPNNCSSKWSQNAVLVDWNSNEVYTDEGETNGVINIDKKANQEGGGLVVTENGERDVITLPEGLEKGQTFSMLILLMEPKDLTDFSDRWLSGWDWTQDVFANGYCSLINGQAYELAVKVVDEYNAIGAIGVDGQDAPVEYYNLQGVRIDVENLIPGIYVRRQGNKVDKVLVK